MNGVSKHEYEAAATLASLISAPISSDDTDILFDAPLRSRSNEMTYSNLSTTQHNMSHEKNSSTGTRKFTREDDIHLIRGILNYGKSSWKKIWKETPELQHIKHAALKDRGRSKRFQNALKWAEMDPTLLDRPYELLGAGNSHWYSKGAVNPATSMDVSPGQLQPISGDTSTQPYAKYSKPLFERSPQDQVMEKKTESTYRTNGKLPTKVVGSAMKKQAVNGNNKRSANDENKPKKSPKKAKHNIKGLRTLRNGEKDEFPGWTLANVKRKQSKVMERFWSHPELHGIQVRSRVGMREMVQTMEEQEVDASTAYEILVSEGKRKYFIGSYRKQP